MSCRQKSRRLNLFAPAWNLNAGNFGRSTASPCDGLPPRCRSGRSPARSQDGVDAVPRPSDTSAATLQKGFYGCQQRFRLAASARAASMRSTNAGSTEQLRALDAVLCALATIRPVCLPRPSSQAFCARSRSFTLSSRLQISESEGQQLDARPATETAGEEDPDLAGCP